ncbi:MAG: polyphosphate polymerase domain-containing protein [Bacteroidetes bacterium]|nr:polyphosphate polymerase domain-containing protein [Bacteroidota bacterium]
MKELNSILDKFNSVSLDNIDEVKLMNRIDRKYWFHISLLNELLEKIIPYYDILEINGKRLMEYQSVYFDTVDNYMYVKHHNRKLNRYKVRRRTYLTTKDDFFEVKLKTNKKRTIKKRIETEFSNPDFFEKETIFLAAETPFRSDELIKSMNNQFFRMTLIHKEKLDRCTIDIQPKFWNEKGEIGFDNLVIFELKRGRSLKSSPIVSLLRQLKIRQRGLSKYCTGRAFLDPKLKRNAFKTRLRYIDKNIIN